MTRFNSKIVGRQSTYAALTLTAATIFSATTIAAQQSKRSQHEGPTSTAEVNGVDVGIKNKLRFPYGIQKFERMKPTQLVTDIPGWEVIGTEGALAAYIANDPEGLPRTGSRSRRWMCVEDYGASAGDGFRTPVVVSPDPWDYGWTFDMKVQAAPESVTNEWPVLAIQHDGPAGFADAWGLQITDHGVNLFLTEAWGVANSVTLFSFATPTAVGDWVNVRVHASVESNKLEAFVNDVSVASVYMRPASTTDLKRQRLSYHGVGAGAQFASVILDDIGVWFSSGVCEESLAVDFTTDDKEAVLVNGQDISTAPEFGKHLAIASGGPNNGAAIFDSSNPGPNAPSQDLDLLIGQGNILILQNDNQPISSLQTIPGIFDRPNDDDEGGTFSFTFNRFLEPLSIDLIDVDEAANEGMVVTLTDFAGRTRTYTVPTDWTGDITQGDVGVLSLDLTALAPQPGNNATNATAVEDPGYNPNGVASMVIVSGGSGGLDNFMANIPCVEITNENEDDGDPDNAGTALADGQDISTPPEYGVEVAIASAGPNLGAANFDSTPGGPNDGVGPGFPDRDLAVGLGNIMILQNTTAPTQTVPGFFDTPNDDQDGGTITFDFPCRVECHYIDLIDFDEEDVDGITLTLEDSSGNTRVFTLRKRIHQGGGDIARTRNEIEDHYF